jgi:hypothetical protein
MRKILVLLSVLFVFTSCSQPGQNSIPTTTIQFKPDGNGFVQYKTNDPANYQWGYFCYYSSTYEPRMTTVTANLVKVSGAVNYGYGLIFCWTGNDNFYTVLISCDGWYMVRRKVNGINSTIQDWIQTPNLTQGLGMSNMLSITQSPTVDGSYNIEINGHPTLGFTDQNLINGGQAGFYASIGSSTEEHFPEAPVDVRFKLASPIAIP